MQSAVATTLPKHWEKRVLAAYLLMMGDIWDSAARKVGRSRTTIAHWENETYWWDQARAEAEARWLYDVQDAARRAVTKQLSAGNGDLGLKVLERLVEDFAPQQKQGVSPQVVQLLVQKVLVYLSDEQAQELLDFMAAQLGPIGPPRVPAPTFPGHRRSNERL